MPADFSLLQPAPNYTAALVSGYQAGAALGAQKRTQAALSALDFSRPESALALVAADPERGVGVLDAVMKMQAVRRQADADQAFGDAVSAVYGRAPTGATPGGNGAPAPTTLSGAGGPAGMSPQPSAPAGIPPGQPLAPDHGIADPRQAAMVRLAYKDQDGFNRVQQSIARMDDDQRKRWSDAQDALGTAAMSARALPYAQRRAHIVSMTPWLLQHGVPQERIDAFDPTDAALDTIRDEAWGMKGMADQHEKDRAYNLDQARFTETQRHDRADEGTAAANAATSRGQLAVAQKRADLATHLAGNSDLGSASTADLLAMARGQKVASPHASASDIFAIAGER